MAREAHAASLGVRNLAGSGAQPLLQNRNVDTYIQFNPIDPQHVRDTAGAARSTAVIRPTFTFKIVRCKAVVKLLRAICTANDFEEVPETVNDVNLIWKAGKLRSHECTALEPHQRVNRFPRSIELTRKDLMVASLRKLQRAAPSLKLDCFLPTTFILPEEFEQFKEEWRHAPGPWIIKPRASAQGKGIYIVQRPSDAQRDESCVACRYVPRPLLLDGYKCDVRLYVVVTSFDPLRVYLFQDGMVRLSTAKYDTSKDGLTNPFAHLTNYSVNKKAANFVTSSHDGADNVGFKRSLAAVLDSLAAEGRDTASLMSKIEAVVLKAVCSIEPAVAAGCRSLFKHGGSCCSEMLGFDILIDQDLNPWLLEVNASPSIATDSPLDFRLKSGALVGFLTLMRIPAVQPERRHRPSSASAAPDTLRAVMEEADIAIKHGYTRLAPDIDRSDRYLPFLQDTSRRNAGLHEMLVGLKSCPSRKPEISVAVQPVSSACFHDSIAQSVEDIQENYRGGATLSVPEEHLQDVRVKLPSDVAGLGAELDSLQLRQLGRSINPAHRHNPCPDPADSTIMASTTLAEIDSILSDLTVKQAHRRKER